MGRKSKLTDEQWKEIERRLLEGESARGLAREFGIAESSLRGKKSAHVAQIKDVADQLLEADRALKKLPISAQETARDVFYRKRAIQNNVLSGVEYAAANFHRLSALASTELAKVDDADPMSTADRLKSHMALTRAANDAAAVPMAVLTANKDAAAKLDEEPIAAEVVVPDDPVQAARAYQRLMGAT